MKAATNCKPRRCGDKIITLQRASCRKKVDADERGSLDELNEPVRLFQGVGQRRTGFR